MHRLRETVLPLVRIAGHEPEAYEYWNHHFNPDPDDCFNLRKKMVVCQRAQ
jgi:hypothetical protein